MYSKRRWLFAILPVLILSACAPKQEAEPVATEEPAATGATHYALCAPIPADQLASWKAFVAELEAERAEHVASNTAAGITREEIWLQESPQGAAAVVYFEGTDLGTMMARREAATDAHSQKFVTRIRAIHGLPEKLTDMPQNTLAFQGDVEGIAGELRSFAMAAPIIPGKEAAHAAFCAELAGPRHEQWLASRRARGIAKEYAWNQHNPDGSVMTVVYFEVTDPANLSKPAEGEFEQWFAQQLLEIHGIPVGGTMPANTLVATF